MLGLVSAMPSGWGPIAEAKIAEVVDAIPPGVISVLLTSASEVEQIIAQQQICLAGALQLVDGLEAGGHARLRRALPGVTILQAVHVGDESSIDVAKALAPHVDGIILDTGSPNAETRVLGGTGLTHDWSISARIVEAVDTPVFLAGGIKAHNVEEAVRTVKPYGLDLCTGVRVDGALKADLLEEFMIAAAAARASH
ncbi:MAG: phosphoribosylanthranilate isomerase [Bradymonadia bacterium]|jgi:phosphoribosylanthranilate isomerase